MMLEYVTKENSVVFTVSKKIYPLEVIFGACHNFIDRCYVFLDQPNTDSIQVSLKGKEQLDSRGMEALAGEFNNELVNQSLRKKINQQNKKLREYIVSRALYSVEPYQEGAEASGAGADEGPGIDEDDFLDDPLQIAVPWDEKYGKKGEDKGNG